MNVNQCTLVGRLGADPEKRSLPDGRSVANFSLATSEKWKDKNGQEQTRTEWHRVVFFGKAADVIAQYSAKGALLFVQGKLQTRKWTDQQGVERYSTEIIGDTFQLGPRPQGSNAGSAAPATGSPPATNSTPPMGGAAGVPAGGTDFTDDIPF